MKFTIDKAEKHCVLKIDEEKLLSTNAPQLKSQLVILNAEEIKNVILDMQDVKYVDSSGLSSILIGNRLCKEMGGTMVLTNLNPTVDKLVKISQLDSILNIIPTVQESIDFILMEEMERELRG